jgi:hypothetical protein
MVQKKLNLISSSKAYICLKYNFARELLPVISDKTHDSDNSIDIKKEKLHKHIYQHVRQSCADINIIPATIEIKFSSHDCLSISKTYQIENVDYLCIVYYFSASLPLESIKYTCPNVLINSESHSRVLTYLRSALASDYRKSAENIQKGDVVRCLILKSSTKVTIIQNSQETFSIIAGGLNPRVFLPCIANLSILVVNCKKNDTLSLESVEGKIEFLICDFKTPKPSSDAEVKTFLVSVLEQGHECNIEVLVNNWIRNTIAPNLYRYSLDTFLRNFMFLVEYDSSPKNFLKVLVKYLEKNEPVCKNFIKHASSIYSTTFAKKMMLITDEDIEDDKKQAVKIYSAARYCLDKAQAVKVDIDISDLYNMLFNEDS